MNTEPGKIKPPRFARSGALSSALRAVIFLGGVALVGAGLSGGPNGALEFFARHSYPIVVGLGLWSLFLTVREARRGTLRMPVQVAVLGIATAVFIFVSVKPDVRIYNDEMKLIGVSKTLYRDREARFEAARLVQNAEILPVAYGVDKRPLLFPFLTHLVHRVSGYRPANAFAVNFLVLCALCVLVLSVFRKRSGPAAAVTALALLAAHPALSVAASSAGSEVLFLLLALTAALALFRFASRDSGANFESLATLLILIAHVRQDGFIFFPIVLGLLVLLRTVQANQLAASWSVTLAPIFLAPVVWQRYYFFNHFSIEMQLPPGKPPFAARFFIENSVTFFKSMLRFGPDIPYAGVVNLLGLAAVAYFIFRFFVNVRAIPARRRAAIWTAGAAVAAYWILISSLWWGSPMNAYVSRLYVFFCVVLSLTAAAFVVRTTRGKWALGAALVAVATFAVFHSLAVEHRFAQVAGLKKRHDVSMEFLGDRGREKFLVVSDNPVVYAVHDYACVKTAYANRHKARLKSDLRRGVYDAIYLVETDYPARRQMPGWKPEKPVFRSRRVFEREISKGENLRISSVFVSGAPAPVPAFPAAPVPGRCSVFAAGDLMLARWMHDAARTGTAAQLFNGVLPFIQGADVAFANLECVFSDRGQIVQKYERQPFPYRARPEMSRFIREAGFDVLNQANNHGGDYGPLALSDSLQIIQTAGAVPIGAGLDAEDARRIRYTEANGVRIAWIAFDSTEPRFAAGPHLPGTFHVPDDQIERTIPPLVREAKKRAHAVLVTCHWGINWREKPTEERRRAARAIIEAGADAVLGHSSHRVHGVEIWKGRPIFYDMASLLFDSVSNPLIRDAIFVRLDISLRGLERAEIHPLSLTWRSTREASPADSERILDKLESDSRELGVLTGYEREGAIARITFPAGEARKEIEDAAAEKPAGVFDFSRKPPCVVPKLPEGALAVDARTPAVFAGAVELKAAILPARAAAGVAFPVSLYLSRVSEIPLERAEINLVASLTGEPKIIFLDHHEPGDWAYPPERWQKGEIIEDIRLVRPAANLPAGKYEIFVLWNDLKRRAAPAGPDSRGWSLGTIEIYPDKNQTSVEGLPEYAKGMSS